VVPIGRTPDKETLVDLRLGIDIACRTAHQASLADHTGRLLWRGHRFHTITGGLDRLWQRLPEALTRPR
jgi:hypothetical protein